MLRVYFTYPRERVGFVAALAGLKVGRVVVQFLPRFPQQLRLVFHLDGRAPKNTEPNDGKNQRTGQGIQNDFFDGAAAGNARDEHADKGGPGDPPTPVKNGPGIHESGGAGVLLPGFRSTQPVRAAAFAVTQLRKGVRVPAQLRHGVLEVIPGGLHHVVHVETRVPKKERDGQNKDTAKKGQLGNEFDAHVQPRQKRGGRDQSNAGRRRRRWWRQQSQHKKKHNNKNNGHQGKKQSVPFAPSYLDTGTLKHQTNSTVRPLTPK